MLVVIEVVVADSFLVLGVVGYIVLLLITVVADIWLVKKETTSIVTILTVKGKILLYNYCL